MIISLNDRNIKILDVAITMLLIIGAIIAGACSMITLCCLLLLFCVIFIICKVKWRKPRDNQQDIFSEKKKRVIALVAMIAVILLSMGISPPHTYYSGYGNRVLYENFSKSLVEGRIDVDYGEDTPDLSQLDNPYDQYQREELLGTHYLQWDNAYYDGKYYMYFGIVPEILFVPFYLITGSTLPAWHATQIFTAAFILGMYFVFMFLKKTFFVRMRNDDVMLIFAASACASSWFIASAPAMYCTAISSGICAAVWSLFFFFKCVWGKQSENKSIAYAAIGSLLMGLVIGCRPSILVFGLVIIPLLIVFLRQRKITIWLVLKLLFAALPMLMMIALQFGYNYIRFDSILEFGQTWQLTCADQREYTDMLKRLNEINIFEALFSDFFGLASFGVDKQLVAAFKYPGLLWECPLLLSLILLFAPATRRFSKDKGLFAISLITLIAAIIIVISQVLSTPFLIERYKSDIVWALCLAAFIAIGSYMMSREEKRTQDIVACEKNENMTIALPDILKILAICTIAASILLFFVPNLEDYNHTGVFWESTLESLQALFG